MRSSLLIGLGAGLVGAVLFISAATGTTLAKLLVYLVPLPAFIAGLGWGVPAALAAGLSGTLVAGAVTPKVALAYALTFALPTIALCHLALLSRTAAAPTGNISDAEPSERDADPGPGGIEWYPVGRILMWASVMAGSLTLLALLFLGGTAENYRTNVETLLDGTLLQELQRMGGRRFGAEERRMLIDFVVSALPAASSVAWLFIMLLNMWLGGRIALASGLLARPWPDLAAITFPPLFPLGFVGAAVAAFLGGMIGLIATGFLGAFTFAYLLLGLAVLHYITRGNPFRTFILAGVYLGLLILGNYGALALVALGMGEPLLGLRARKSAGGGARPPPPAPSD